MKEDVVHVVRYFGINACNPVYFNIPTTAERVYQCIANIIQGSLENSDEECYFEIYSNDEYTIKIKKITENDEITIAEMEGVEIFDLHDFAKELQKYLSELEVIPDEVTNKVTVLP